MKFRDMRVDDIIVVGPLEQEEFVKELKKIHRKYIVVDLQYAVVTDGMSDGHSALALVRRKK